jgi:hypothetical protein
MKRFLMFTLWFIAGMFILPCVIVAKTFEGWAKWASNI